MKTMDLHRFKKWITAEGFLIRTSGKHHELVASDGDSMDFAILHKKGGKRVVLPPYLKAVKLFIEKKKGKK